MLSFFKQMYLKVRVIAYLALLGAVGGALDTLANVDWTAELGAWAVPISLGVGALLAWWRREHPSNT